MYVCCCGTDLIWSGDFTYEDYARDGDGIVSNYTCPNEECDVEDVVYWVSNEPKDKKE